MVEHITAAPLDDTYAALAHPVRRAVLERLRSGPERVTALARPFQDLSLAAVSKHLRVLEEASLIRREVSGREHHLHLEPGPLGAAASWLESYRSFWEERLEALEAVLGGKERSGRRR